MHSNGTATMANKSPKPHRTIIQVKTLTVSVHPDRSEQFTDELENLCRKYAGANYTFDFQEIE